jgi:hypothetical protein
MVFHNLKTSFHPRALPNELAIHCLADGVAAVVVFLSGWLQRKGCIAAGWLVEPTVSL